MHLEAIPFFINDITKLSLVTQFNLNNLDTEKFDFALILINISSRFKLTNHELENYFDSKGFKGTDFRKPTSLILSNLIEESETFKPQSRLYVAIQQAITDWKTTRELA